MPEIDSATSVEQYRESEKATNVRKIEHEQPKECINELRDKTNLEKINLKIRNIRALKL